MSDLPRIAARNVARNRRRSLITIGAITLGVTAVITVRGFIGGFIKVMVEDVVEGRTGALQIHRKGYLDALESAPLSLDLPHDPQFVGKLRAVEGVRGVTGRIGFTGLVSNGLSQTMFVGRALDLTTEREVCPRFGMDVLEGGNKLEPGDSGVALLGGELAQSFNAVPPALKAAEQDPTRAEGLVSVVTLSSSSPKGRANSLEVTVKGLTASSVPFENKRVVIVPLPLAQELLGMQGRVTEYAVAIQSLDQLEVVADRLRALLGPEYEVSTWRELQPFVRDVLARQQYLLGLLALMLFVIILTGIVNTMLMSVFERVREIGTMMAVGIRRRQVLALFLLEASLLGLLGGILGGLLGRGVVALLAVRGFELSVGGSNLFLRPIIGLPFILQAIAVAALGALLAALYPAWKASRLSPVEALRSL